MLSTKLLTVPAGGGCTPYDQVDGNVAAGATFTHPADGVVAWTQTVLPIGVAASRIFVRLQDASNGWLVTMTNMGHLRLYSWVANTAALVVGTDAGAVVAGDRIAVVLNGNFISARINSQEAWSYSNANNFTTATNGKRNNTIGTESGTISDLKVWSLACLSQEGEQFSGFDNLDNAAAALSIPTYEGSGQAIHPDVIDFGASGWNGHRYWMAFTPYPNSNDTYENPSIVVSDDNITWSVPAGLANPIDTKPANGYNADTDLVYNDDTDELWCYYLKYDRSAPINTVYMMLSKSSDGIMWSEPVSLLSWDLDVVGDNERSYAIVKQGANWHYWAQTNTATHRVVYRSSSDGEIWSAASDVAFAPVPSSLPWHLNVEYITDKSAYWMVFSAPTSGGNLFFATSIDRINWTFYPRPLLRRGDAGAWDAHTIYRSALLYDNATDLVRLWYSAHSAANVWGTGYTQGTFTDLASYLGIS